MDDQQLLQLLHDKQPLLWTRAEGQILWDRLQESELLRQSLRSQAALRDRAATVLASADHDLDALLAAEAEDSADLSKGKSAKTIWVAMLAVLLLAVAIGAMVIRSTSDSPPEPVAEVPSTEPDTPAEKEPSDQEPKPSPEEEPVDSATETDPATDPPEEPSDDQPPVATPNQPEEEPRVQPPEPPLPESEYVSGPWDAVINHQEVPTFAEVCFDDFDLTKQTFDKASLEPWLKPVKGESHEIGETKRNNRETGFMKGVMQLQSPWTEQSWLRFRLTDTKEFFIHLFNGEHGLTLAHYEEGPRTWAAYVTQREAGKPTPQAYALTACDDRRNSRTIRHDDGTVMIGWREGEIIIVRGDVVLLRAPLAQPPRQAFFEGRALFEGMQIVRTSDAPAVGYRRELQELTKPAELEWDTEKLTDKETFEKLDDGSVRLSSKGESEPTWVMASVPQHAMRAIVFELSDYTPGASVLLRHDEQSLSGMYRITRDTPEDQLVIHETGDRNSFQQDLGKLEEKKMAAVGERVWIKLLQGSHMVRSWVSVDGKHWAEIKFPDAQHNVPVTGIGIQLTGNVTHQTMTLRGLYQEPLSALHSLVDQELLEQASTITEAKNYGSWLVEVSARQPEEIDPGAWRRACAMQTVGAGCEKELASELLGSLLDYAIELDMPLEQKCNIIDDALLLSYGWEHGNRILEQVIGRYFEAAQHAYRQGETDFPYSSVRRRAMSGQYVHYNNPRLSQTEAVEKELLHLTATSQWEATLRTCKQLKFFEVEHHEPLIEWAQAIAQRGAAIEVGSAGIAPLKASWRHPLEEELSKETYNLVAELKALLDSDAYTDAARLITMVNPTSTSGVAPSPHDEHLLLSLSAAIDWSLSEHPALAQAMNTQFADLAQLRVKKAIGEGFAPDVILAATQFAPTPAAGQAHRWLGDRALSVGRFQQALAEYRLALMKSDGPMQAEIEPRLRLAAAMLGEQIGEPVEREVHLGERNISPADFEEIVSNMRERANSDSSSSVIEVAQAAPRSVPPPSHWKVEKRGQVEGPQGRDSNSTVNRHVRDFKLPWADRQMVVKAVGDTMYMANRFQVSAYRRDDGHRLWQSETPEGNPLRSQEWPLVPMRPLIVGEHIVVRMLYDEGPQLVCLNRDGGKIQWSVAGTRSRVVASDPLWVRNELMVIMWDYTREQNGQLTLCRYDLHSGELLQSQVLVSMRDSWFERKVCEVAPLDDGLLIATGGALLRCSARGDLKWIRRQELTPPEEYAGWVKQSWQRPLVIEETAYVMQPGVMSLQAVGIETGNLLWSVSMTDLRRVLGVVDDHLLIEREGQVSAIDRKTGETAWMTPIGFPLLEGYLLDQKQLLMAAQQQRRDSNRETYPELISLDPHTGQIVARSMLSELKHKDPQVGSLVSAEDRLWLFYGKGSQEVGRELMELKPEQPITPLPPPLPLAQRVWSQRVDRVLAEAVSRNAPGWHLWHTHYDTKQELGYREEDHGRHDLCALMLTEEAPLVLARSMSFSPRARPKLRLVVGADPGREWLLKVTVAGQQREPLEIKQDKYNDYWKTLEIDLTQHAGTSGWITVEMKTAHGTNFPIMLDRMELVQ